MAAVRDFLAHTSELPGKTQAMEWLSGLIRRLFGRVIRLYMKRALSLTLSKWRVTTIASRTRNTNTAGLSRNRSYGILASNPGAKRPVIKSGQVMGSKLGVKSVSGSPNVSVLQLGSEGGTGHSVTAKGRKEASHQLLSPKSLKRPTSVPPTESPASKPITPFQLFQSPQSLDKAHTPKPELDVGTRLFQKAQEMENRLEAMRKSLEPDYSFKPSLARNTGRWLSQKSAKSTPKKQRAVHDEDVAVVSSAAAISVLSRIAETGGKEIGRRKPEKEGNKQVHQGELQHKYVLVDFAGDSDPSDPYLSP